MKIDFHCHLDLYPNPSDLVECVARDNIFVLSVTTTPSAYPGTLQLAAGKTSIHTALGLHPQLAAERHRELVLFDRLLPSARFVGEVGLDGSPEFRASWQAQEKVFQHVLQSCTRVGGRIMSIHSRRASTQVLTMLKQVPDAGTAVMHWFSGSQRDLREAIAMSCWFSVNLPMFTSEKGRAILSKLPQNRVLTETDGPFTSNELRSAKPQDVGQVVSQLALLWNCCEEETELILNRNLAEVLHLAGLSI